MDDKYLQILMILLEQDYVLTQELSITLRKTNRTIRTYLKELDDILKKHGAKITMAYNKGQHLEIVDEQLFTSWISHIQLSSIDYNVQEDRIVAIFSFLIFKQEYIKQQDMMDNLFISSKQLKDDLKIVKKILKSFQLELITKPYKGMKIEGTESDIRACIAHLYYKYSTDFLKQNIQDFDKQVQSIQNIVFSCVAHESYHISDDNLNQLVIYIVIALARYQKAHCYLISQTFDESSVSYQIAMNIAMMIEKITHISLEQNEISYIAIGILSKENKVLENNQQISEQIERLVMKMMNRIEKYYGISFINEFDLFISLSLHIEPLLSRIHYRTFIHNPLTKDIKIQLYQSYEMAMLACEVLNEQYHVILPEDEIAMLALHIELAYERKLSKVQKKNILIICSSGVGTAKFIKARFEKQFGDFLNQIDVIGIMNIESYDLYNYDCIFTTIHLTLPINKPVIKIEPIFNQNDYNKIENHLQNHIYLEKYLKEDLYFYKFECINKKDCLKKMIDHMKSVYSLPLEFEDLVLRREELGSTEFSNVIALPHPIYPISHISLLSIAILKRAIIWNNHKIRIVILMSVSDCQNMVELDEVYHIISAILANKVLQNQLIHSTSYQEMIESIRGYL